MEKLIIRILDSLSKKDFASRKKARETFTYPATLKYYIMTTGMSENFLSIYDDGKKTEHSRSI